MAPLGANRKSRKFASQRNLALLASKVARKILLVVVVVAVAGVVLSLTSPLPESLSNASNVVLQLILLPNVNSRVLVTTVKR